MSSTRRAGRWRAAGFVERQRSRLRGQRGSPVCRRPDCPNRSFAKSCPTSLAASPCRAGDQLAVVGRLVLTAGRTPIGLGPGLFDLLTVFGRGVALFAVVAGRCRPPAARRAAAFPDRDEHRLHLVRHGLLPEVLRAEEAVAEPGAVGRFDLIVREGEGNQRLRFRRVRIVRLGEDVLGSAKWAADTRAERDRTRRRSAVLAGETCRLP